MKIRAALVVISAMLVSACGLNSVPTAEENAKAKWADVEVAYQRRAESVPGLLEIVKGSAASEGKILNDVVSARSRATSITLSGDDLTDPAKVAQFQQAQEALSGSLGRLMVVVERYPELKSQANFTKFMDQFEGANNRISIAQRDYNEAVRKYNTTIRTFPSSIGARVFYGAEPMVPFQAAAGSEAVPEISFGNDS
jgi:LemA protein